MIIAITGIIDSLLKIHVLRLQSGTPEQVQAEIARHDAIAAPFLKLWMKLTRQGEDA